MARCIVCGEHVDQYATVKRRDFKPKKVGQPMMARLYYLCREHERGDAYEVHPLVGGTCLVLDKRTGVVTSHDQPV